MFLYQSVERQSLASALGGKTAKVLDVLDGDVGYGREFKVEKDFRTLVADVRKIFKTEKVLAYGQGRCSSLATFCGSGGSHALSCIKDGVTSADTVLTSDLAHHEIQELIEKNKKIIILPHYVAEEYGFKIFSERVKESLLNKVKTEYFCDERFK